MFGVPAQIVARRVGQRRTAQTPRQRHERRVAGLREVLVQLGPVMKKLHTKHDWRESGGAPLLGVAGYCLICHGRSDARAIKNAIRVGKQLHKSAINDKIVDIVGKSIPAET